MADLMGRVARAVRRGGGLASNGSAGSKKAVARVTPRLITTAMLVLVIVLMSLAIAAALR
jgi:hypothetical protein